MALSKRILKQKFSARAFVWSLVLGLAMITGILYHSYEPDQYDTLLQADLFWVVTAIVMLVVRDLGYMYRIRYVTDKVLSWKRSLNVILLWEFASSVLPSVIGGTTAGIYILFKEKIPLGRSVAHVMVTSMLDNMYFVLAVPFVLYVIRENALPELIGLGGALRETLAVAFIVSYVLIALYAFTMFYALFINPQAVKRVLLYLGKQKLLRRWRVALCRHANELLLSSKQLRSKPAAYWLHTGVATVFVWTARYVIIGCLVAAFTHLNLADHLVIFSRNLIYKIVLFVSVTPGAAGIAEVAFPAFFGAFLGSFTITVVLLYRLITYYLYIIIGAVLFPHWAARVIKNNDNEKRRGLPIPSETPVRKKMAV